MGDQYVAVYKLRISAVYRTGVLLSQLAVVGAIAAAGIAIVAGVKHVRAEKQEPELETFGGKVKRKVTFFITRKLGKRIGPHRSLRWHE